MATIVVVVDVIMRYGFASGLKGSVEVCSIMVAMLAFLGLAWAQIKGAHVRVEFLYARFPRRLQFATNLFSGIICLVCLILLSYASVDFAIERFMGGERGWASAIQVPIWPGRFSVALGFIVFSLVVFVELFKSGASASDK